MENNQKDLYHSLGKKNMHYLLIDSGKIILHKIIGRNIGKNSGQNCK